MKQLIPTTDTIYTIFLEGVSTFKYIIAWYIQQTKKCATFRIQCRPTQ